MFKQVDISDKKVVKREARAFGRIFLKEDTIEKIKNKEIKKGDPLEAAQIAAINAVKQTQYLIPLCHQIPITFVNTVFEIRKDSIEATVEVRAEAKTGVEMEALVGVSICLSTIWDMVKYLEKDEEGQYPTTRITDIRVLEKVKG
jgi:cyclic pyranopterin phosphate synthase